MMLGPPREGRILFRVRSQRRPAADVEFRPISGRRRTPTCAKEPPVKSDIHPRYRPVVFQDMSGNFSFLTRSTIESHETTVWEDGNTYPLVKVDISSASHPFFTGKQTFVDTAGRVDRFQKKFGGKLSFQVGGAKK
jgi:large subunit ribosomal protein L31